MLNYITKSIITVLVISVSFLIGLKSSRTEAKIEVIPEYHTVIDTLYKTNIDTIFIDADKHLFRSIDDYVLFVKYIKTQSNITSSELGQNDIWSIVQTMYNRMNDSDVNWNKYYNSKKVNNSESIKKMKVGKLRPRFNWNSVSDLWILSTSIKTSLQLIPDSLVLDINVLYFESFKQCPNRNPHWCDSLVMKYRHKFYKGNLKD